MKKLLVFLFLAINCFAGTIITLPPGRVVLTKPLYIEHSDTTIIGNGSVLTIAKHVNCPVLVIGERSLNPKVRISNIIVKDLIVDGNKDYQDSEYMAGREYLRNNCITIRGADGVLLENIITSSSRSGGIVCEKGSKNIVINGLNSHGHIYDGFAACESTEILLINALLQWNYAAGISLDWGANNNKFKNVTIIDNGDQSIFMRDSRGNIFSFIHIGNQGIFIGLRNSSEADTGCFNNTFLLFNKPKRIECDPRCLNNQFFLLTPKK